jgi:hypothetical protein
MTVMIRFANRSLVMIPKGGFDGRTDWSKQTASSKMTVNESRAKNVVTRWQYIRLARGAALPDFLFTSQLRYQANSVQNGRSREAPRTQIL